MSLTAVETVSAILFPKTPSQLAGTKLGLDPGDTGRSLLLQAEKARATKSRPSGSKTLFDFK
jgi:hypothetical protein